MTEPTVEELWAMVPEVECRGHCAKACRVIGMSESEFIKMEDERGEFPPFAEMLEDQREVGDSYRCPNLSQDGQCQAYEVRPLVCRLYGASDAVPCPWHCKVRGLPLTKEESSNLWQRMAQAHGPVV